MLFKLMKTRKRSHSYTSWSERVGEKGSSMYNVHAMDISVRVRVMLADHLDIPFVP